MQETISNQQAINKQRYHYNDYTLTLEYDPETCFNSTCLMEKGTIVYAKTSMSISPELASELEISYYTASSSIEQASQLINSYIATQKVRYLSYAKYYYHFKFCISHYAYIYTVVAKLS